MTIFLLAICENRLELVQMILKSVMDKRKLLSQKDIYGNGIIHLAVLGNSTEILALLLAEGVQRDLKNNVHFSFIKQIGETPVDLANAMKRKELVGILGGTEFYTPIKENGSGLEDEKTDDKASPVSNVSIAYEVQKLTGRAERELVKKALDLSNAYEDKTAEANDREKSLIADIKKDEPVAVINMVANP